MSFGAAADSIYQQARSDYTASTGWATEDRWAIVGYPVSDFGDHLWVEYMSVGEYVEYDQPGVVMIARNFTGVTWEPGTKVRVEWMDDGMASMLKIADRGVFLLPETDMTGLAHVGGVDKLNQKNGREELLETIIWKNGRIMTAHFLKLPDFPHQAVCADPTERWSYYVVCDYRRQVIRCVRGISQVVAGIHQGIDAAIDPLGSLGGNTVIDVSNADGTDVEFVIVRPLSLAADADGGIYAICAPSSGYHSRLIGKFTVGGTWEWIFGYSTTYGYSGDGGLARDATGSDQIMHLAVGIDGSIYFSDPIYNVVRKISAPISATSIVTRVVGVDPLLPLPPDVVLPANPLTVKLTAPGALAVSGTGDLYIAEPQRLYRLTGTLLSLFAGGGPTNFDFIPIGPGYFKLQFSLNIHALTIGLDGRCYALALVYSMNPKQAMLIAIDETFIYLVAGSDGDEPGPVPSVERIMDYSGRAARINLAYSLSVDSLSGQLFFADNTRYVVRRVVGYERWMLSNAYSFSCRVYRSRGGAVTYNQLNSVGVTGFIGMGVAELDGAPRLVGFRWNAPNFAAPVFRPMVFRQTVTNPAGEFMTGVPTTSANGNIVGAYQWQFVTMQGMMLVFNRINTTQIQVSRLVEVAPPPNEGPGDNYILVEYDMINVPETAVIHQACSSGTYASVVYILFQVSADIHFYMYDGVEFKRVVNLLPKWLPLIGRDAVFIELDHFPLEGIQRWRFYGQDASDGTPYGVRGVYAEFGIERLREEYDDEGVASSGQFIGFASNSEYNRAVKVLGQDWYHFSVHVDTTHFEQGGYMPEPKHQFGGPQRTNSNFSTFGTFPVGTNRAGVTVPGGGPSIEQLDVRVVYWNDSGYVRWGPRQIDAKKAFVIVTKMADAMYRPAVRVPGLFVVTDEDGWIPVTEVDHERFYSIPPGGSSYWRNEAAVIYVGKFPLDENTWVPV